MGYSFTRDIAASLFPSVSVFYVGDLQFLRQFVLKYQSNFQEVYTNADFQVYKIRYRHDD